jgi:hypothetical protein
LATQKFSQQIMEPGGSLPCSQEPSAGPWLEPAQSSPYHPILSLLRSILIFSHLCIGILSGLFALGSPTEILYVIPICPHTCYIPHLSHPSLLDVSNFMWLRVQVMKLLIMDIILQHPVVLRHHYAVFSNLPSLHFSLV